MTSIIEVARIAKCSISTVSYALTGKRPVQATTRKRILGVCERLGYVPNAAARNLRTQRTELVGLLLYPDCSSQFRNSFAGEVIEGLEERLIETGYHLLVGGYAPQIGRGTVPIFMGQGRVDGVVLLGQYPDAVIMGLHAMGQPLLLLDSEIESLPIDSVTTDGFTAGRLAVEHAYANGHRRLLMLGYALDSSNARHRRAGFLAGIRQHRLGSARQSVIASFISHDDGYALLRKRLGSDGAPTLVFCENDTLALAMIDRLTRDGVAVPGALSVIGFNDDDVGRTSQPPLTTFAIDKRALGRAGADMILSRVAEPASATVKRRMPAPLIQRSSVSQAASPRSAKRH